LGHKGGSCVKASQQLATAHPVAFLNQKLGDTGAAADAADGGRQQADITSRLQPAKRCHRFLITGSDGNHRCSHWGWSLLAN
jgi:hypothetical protein